MIKFKQKEFWIGTAASIAVPTVIGMKQAHDSEKQNEELAEQQRRDAAKTRAALDRLANSGVSQEKKAEAASLFSDLRVFANVGGVAKNLGGLAKDLWTHSGSAAKSAAKMGAGMAAAGYIGNRVATSIKDHDEGNDKKTGNFLAKAAGTAAAVGGGILAAKRGYLGKGAQDFITTGYGHKALKTAKSVLSENVSPIKRTGKGRVGISGSGTIGLGFGMMPVASYLAQRKSQEDMVDSTQRQYAMIGSGVLRWTKNAAKHLVKNPGRALTGGFNKVANTFGMMGTSGGTAATQGQFKKLGEIGKRSGNVYTQKLANWGQNHKNLANLASGAAVLGVGSTAMGIGEKIVNKPMKVLDRDAYKMEEQENDKI